MTTQAEKWMDALKALQPKQKAKVKRISPTTKVPRRRSVMNERRYRYLGITGPWDEMPH